MCCVDSTCLFVRNAETLGISNRLQESAISKMEIGDLLIEVDLVVRTQQLSSPIDMFNLHHVNSV